LHLLLHLHLLLRLNLLLAASVRSNFSYPSTLSPIIEFATSLLAEIVSSFEFFTDAEHFFLVSRLLLLLSAPSAALTYGLRMIVQLLLSLLPFAQGGPLALVGCGGGDASTDTFNATASFIAHCVASCRSEVVVVIAFIGHNVGSRC
jgi:hypothetical protein